MRFLPYILALFICVSCTDPKAPLATDSTKVKTTDSLVARTSILQNTKKDAIQVALVAEKHTALEDTTTRRDTVFTCRFKKDSACLYQIIQVYKPRKPRVETRFYSILTRDSIEIDRNELDERVGFFQWIPIDTSLHDKETAYLKDSFTETGIEGIEEVGVIYQSQDNEEENSTGESSESYEWSITRMLFGKTGDKLIQEFLTYSSGGSWYESERDEEDRLMDYWYEDVTKESFYLPDEKNGLENCLVYEMDQLRDRSANGRQDEGVILDTCEDHYHVKKFLPFKDGVFVEERRKPVFKEVKNEEGVSVRDVPSACWGEEVGTIDFEGKVEVLEMSDISSRVVNDYGIVIHGYWIKIRFPHEADSVGYVFGGDMKYFRIDE